MSDNRIQKFFDPKRITKKNVFLINVSNANSKPEEFSYKDIKLFLDSKEQNWFKQTYVGKFLGIENIRTSLNGLEKCEMLTRQELVSIQSTTTGWSGPKDQQNKTDKFLSAFGVMYVIVNSKKDKGKALRYHILKDIVSREFDVRIEKIHEKHRQAVEEKVQQLHCAMIT